VARRMGLPDAEIKAARTATGDAFVELVAAGGDEPVELLVSVGAQPLTARLRSGSQERTVLAPPESTPPA